MPASSFHTLYGIGWLRRWPVQLLLLGATLVLGLMMGFLGAKLAVVLAILPFGALFAALVVTKPEVGLWYALLFSFLASGLTRYIPIPWGLMIDMVLGLAVMGWLVQQLLTKNWKVVQRDVLLLTARWCGYVFLEMFNPVGPGPVAWFYAMRALGFYTLIGFVLTFTYLRHHKHMTRFLEVIFILSVLGALWGLKQKFLGTDAAEHHWLYAEGHHDEHVLHGVLRAVAFYSDAGQFGASQIMITLMSGILLLAPFSWRRKVWYAVVLIFTALGFLYSGARGALAVPVAGGVLYMILSKNFKILLLGLVAMGSAYGLLKYTLVAHSFQPVARLRTALSSDNPSLQARLRNQRTLGMYLASRPMGGGVGSAGFWGERFRPGSLLAVTPTDSYYVRIWVETGLVGLCLHLFLLGYFLGKGSIVAWRLKDPKLRAQVLAIMCAFAGVLLANYGNQVLLQFPTGIIMAIALPLVFMAPEYDRQIMEEKSKL